MQPLFDKVLIANRGEIALRVMRTAKDMGIKTVAVYSEADRNAPHVRFADEAVLLGPSPSSQSYLDGAKIIKEAKRLGVDAIHPGYGFLSENAAFAEAVEDAGIRFIGPSPDAIRIMGSKLEAKAAVKEYNIPMVPGTNEPVSDLDEVKSIAVEIGYPVLIKASAGGGGKGMRILEKESELEGQVERAMSEAKAAFGDSSVFIEKHLASPRHIEIQIFGDNYGNYIHLFERECSIQRRHQKVIEEAPSSAVTPDLRERMGKDAINVAKACKYTGAGTVEFLLDEKGNYYFLEMNTRLQVEHPVTEMITGLDLVAIQFSVAAGKALSVRQEDLEIQGHAIELRVYAEDPDDDFLPSTGKLIRYRPPSGAGVRIDDGYEEGMDVPIYYDPLLSKVITHGSTRYEAIHRMKEAIEAFLVEGVATTLPFGFFVMEHEAFIKGIFNTHFVGKHFLGADDPRRKDMYEKAAILAAKLIKQNRKKLHLPNVPDNYPNPDI